MFSIGAIQPAAGHNAFANGGYAGNGKLNGAQVMAMQSKRNLDRVLPDFEEAIAAGYNPNDVKDVIFEKYHLSDSDFTDFDARLLVSKVENMYKSARTRR
jgi:hypothetical protein